MEAYSSFNSEEAKGMKTVHHPFHSLLHSVRKSPAKTCKKAPVAPMPPTRAKVYKVDPINFRDLVQQLTGARASPSPPIMHNLSSRNNTATRTNWYQELQSEAFGFEMKPQETSADVALTLEMNRIWS